MTTSIVRVDRFIQATRDSGYRGTPSAIAELVDNAIQASAKNITVQIDRIPGDYPIRIVVADTGRGMSFDTVREALRFGGSSRFGSRSGLGRFGMGLPNASLSQSRRVEVYTWTEPSERPLFSYLDVDVISEGRMKRVPVPRRRELPSDLRHLRKSRSGTVVIWNRADRLDNRRISTLASKLEFSLGRIFRHFIWGGVRLFVNDVQVRSVDPLFVSPVSRTTGAVIVDEWSCEVRNSEDPTSAVGTVSITFSLLPVKEWFALSSAEKRSMGIVNGAGVSVVRGGREVDYGWFFMGGRRRQNYDDWWRCEVRFDPVLDDAFGVTHTKQQIRPASHLVEAISPYIEMVAQELHSRIRREYKITTAADHTPIEARASANDSLLPLLPAPREGLVANHVSEASFSIASESSDKALYHIVEQEVKGETFYTPIRVGKKVVVGVDPKHPFFTDLYGPVVKSGNTKLADALKALLLSVARADMGTTNDEEHRIITEFRQRWSTALEVFLTRYEGSPS